MKRNTRVDRKTYVSLPFHSLYFLFFLNYIDREAKMRAGTKITDNASWENWGTNGLVFGLIFMIIGVLTQIFEFPRVYNGSSNIDIINNNTDSLYLISNYYQHWWPWTYAANLFGIFTFSTGIIGILAGLRRTYTSIYGLFTMSFVSAVFSIYLIVYFSFIISFYRSNGLGSASNRTQPQSVSYGLASTQLVIALLNLIVSVLSAIFAGRAIALGVEKGVTQDDIPQYMLTPPLRRAY